MLGDVIDRDELTLVPAGWCPKFCRGWLRWHNTSWTPSLSPSLKAQNPLINWLNQWLGFLSTLSRQVNTPFLQKILPILTRKKNNLPPRNTEEINKHVWRAARHFRQLSCYLRLILQLTCSDKYMIWCKSSVRKTHVLAAGANKHFTSCQPGLICMHFSAVADKCSIDYIKMWIKKKSLLTTMPVSSPVWDTSHPETY